jgi:hypothetical protein
MHVHLSSLVLQIPWLQFRAVPGEQVPELHTALSVQLMWHGELSEASGFAGQVGPLPEQYAGTVQSVAFALHIEDESTNWQEELQHTFKVEGSHASDPETIQSPQ